MSDKRACTFLHNLRRAMNRPFAGFAWLAFALLGRHGCAFGFGRPVCDLGPSTVEPLRFASI
jgi:hypothetical protein